MSQRNKIKKTLITWSGYELDGKLPEVIDKLQKVMTDNPDFFDFEMSVETESGWYDSYSTNVTIEANRWETDSEMEERIALSKKRSEAAKLAAKRKAIEDQNKERQLYEALKRKFENELNKQ